MSAAEGMTVREVIAELERFDLDAPVRVSLLGDAYKVRDIGRRDRPATGVHPLLHVGAADVR